MSQHNMQAMTMWLQQQARRFESQCSSAQQRVRGARSMRDVKTAVNVHAGAEIRFLPEVRLAQQRLQQVAEQRMSELLEEQLTALRAAETREACDTQRHRYLQQEWCFLRGDFPRQCRHAEDASSKLRNRYTAK